jgi:CDP-diglyceride synthetase
VTLLKKTIVFILVFLFIVFWFLPFHTWNIIASILLVIWFLSTELYIVIHPANQKKSIRITYFLTGALVLVLGLLLSREQLPAIALIAYTGTGLLMVTRSLRNKNKKVMD